MDEKTVNDVLAVRRQFLHGIGHRMEGIVSEGSVTFHYHLGKYTGKLETHEKADEAKEWQK